MTIYERVENDMKAALKSGDKERRGVLQSIKSDLMYAKINQGVDLAKDELVVGVLRKILKKRQESIEEFRKGERADLVAVEETQAKIVEAYLPAGLSEGELTALVDEVLKETGATTKKDMGRVMKAVFEKSGGRADGGAVSKLVGSRLA